jgi:hypothetical protein
MRTCVDWDVQFVSLRESFVFLNPSKYRELAPKFLHKSVLRDSKNYLSTPELGEICEDPPDF